MNMRNIRIGGMTLVMLGGLVTPSFLAGCNQNPPDCVVGHAVSSNYAAVSKVQSMQGSCTDADKANSPPTQFGMEDYHATAGPDQTDFTKTSVYIQAELFNPGDDPSGLFTRESCFSAPDADTGYKGGNFTDTKDPLWANGKFSDIKPDADNFCHVVDLTTEQVNVPAIPATTAKTNPAPTCASPAAACDNGDKTFNFSCRCATAGADDCCDVVPGACGKAAPKSMRGMDCQEDADCCKAGDTGCMNNPPAGMCEAQAPDAKTCHTSAIPAEGLSYTWSDVNVYVTPSAPGTQMSATVKYVHDSCQITYKINAVFPTTDCTLTDADGNPIDKDGKPLPDGAKPLPNPLACCPNADSAHGHPSGSQINPDFAVHCDPDLLLCVLDGDVPSLNDQGYPKGCSAPKPITN